jgi:hypothetical protein
MSTILSRRTSPSGLTSRILCLGWASALTCQACGSEPTDEITPATTGGTQPGVDDTTEPGAGQSSGSTESGNGGVATGASSGGGSDAGGSGGAFTGGGKAVVGGRAGRATGGTSTGGAVTGGADPGTGGFTATCSVAPVNPNATLQARNLLCYLYDQYGNHVLSGQQETSWRSPENDVNWYNTNVGKYPAILGGDYLYPNGTTTRAQAYWAAGGISMIRYHMGAPPLSDTFANSQSSANIANVLTEGTGENTSFRSKLDYAAAELAKLQAANVPVLWAPFHEAQPGGWFWWAKGTAAEFVQLWIYMFDYFTATKGLNNLVWLMPFSGSPNASVYPGKDYVDIAGPDTYATGQPFASLFTSSRNIVGTTLPIPLHETGVIPQPSAMFPSSAPWVLFNIWAGYQTSNNSLSDIQTAYASPYTVTRDEVPNLK